MSAFSDLVHVTDSYYNVFMSLQIVLGIFFILVALLFTVALFISK